MLHDIENSAAALYDGGWRSTDKAELIAEYELTEDEADTLCKALAKLDDNKMVTINITWSDGSVTTEHGHNPAINQPEFTAESLYKLFCNMAAWNKDQPQPVSYKEVRQ